MPKKLIIALSAWLVLGHVHGQGIVLPAQSRSGQFTARNLRPQYNNFLQKEPTQVPMAGGWAFMLPPEAPTSSDAPQKLDPALLVISCERLKSAVLTELNLADQWRGRINLTINSLLREDSEPRLTAIHALDGWIYEMEVPPSIKPRHLSRALVNVILLEIANRSAGSESTQIPLWLVEGLTSQVQGDDGTMVLRSKQRFATEQRVTDQMNLIRKHLQQQSPMTFEELSWPEASQIKGAGSPQYLECAQLFVYELVRLKDGRECLCQFLNGLPRYLNWQLAFLTAYKEHFQQLRDVEKWWGMTCLNAATQYPTVRLSAKESWLKLQEALDIPVQVHLNSDQLPSQASVRLQDVIQQWDPEVRTVTLERTVARLLSMKPRIDPELTAILDAYCITLNTYLNKRPKGWMKWMQADNSSQHTKNATCRQLQDLDTRREALRARIKAPQQAGSKMSPMANSK